MKKTEDKTAAVVVTRVATESDELSASEERILRMRSGASLSKRHRLENKIDDVAAEHKEEVLAKLALIEAEALEEIEANPELRTDTKKRIIEFLRLLNFDD